MKHTRQVATLMLLAAFGAAVAGCVGTGSQHEPVQWEEVIERAEATLDAARASYEVWSQIHRVLGTPEEQIAEQRARLLKAIDDAERFLIYARTMLEVFDDF